MDESMVKAEFVALYLAPLLKALCRSIKSVIYQGGLYQEIVRIDQGGGSCVDVNVTGDSCSAMVVDVVRQYLERA